MEQDYAYLNQALRDMVLKIDQVGQTFDASLQPIYLIAGVIILCIACIKLMTKQDLAGPAYFVLKYIELMVVILLSRNWLPLTDGYVSQMGSWGAGAAGFSVLQLAPGTVIIRGLGVAGDMYTNNLSWLRLLFGSTQDNIAHLLLGIGLIAVIILSVLMAAMLMLFFVTFKFASVIALAFLVFYLFSGSRFMAAPGVARMLAYGVQMLILSVVVGLFFTVISALDLSGHLHVGQSLSILVIFFFFAFLFKKTLDLSREQISGTPGNDFHDIGRISLPAMAMAAGAVGGVLGATGAMAAAGGAPRAGAAIASFGSTTAKLSGGSRSAPATAMRMMATSTAAKASAWNEPPTGKQAQILKSNGMDPSKMNRGQASRAIEKLPNFDPSWY